MSNHDRTDGELRSITFRDEDDYDYGRPRFGGDERRYGRGGGRRSDYDPNLDRDYEESYAPRGDYGSRRAEQPYSGADSRYGYRDFDDPRGERDARYQGPYDEPYGDPRGGPYGEPSEDPRRDPRYERYYEDSRYDDPYGPRYDPRDDDGMIGAYDDPSPRGRRDPRDPPDYRDDQGYPGAAEYRDPRGRRASGGPGGPGGSGGLGGHGGPGGPDGPRGRVERRGGADPHRNKTRTALLIMLALLMMLTGGLVLTVYIWSESTLSKANRVSAFENLDEDRRPAKANNDSLNFLLAGTDAARNGQRTTGKGREGASGRADTIMIVHLTADRKHAYLISIPRDSWVDIPGYGMNKINASFSLGGPALYIQTVEQLTGLRMDHYAAIDWAGFKALTNALGGVEMTFEEETILANGDTLPAGTQTLNGEEALLYVRDRKHLPNGDFDRAKRQQNFMRALMKQTMSRDTLTDIGKLNNVLNAIVSNLDVDKGFSNGEMRDLAKQLTGIRPSSVEFMTVPTDDPRTGMIEGQSVVFLDEEKLGSLFESVRKDKTQQWLDKHDADTLGEDVN